MGLTVGVWVRRDWGTRFVGWVHPATPGVKMQAVVGAGEGGLMGRSVGNRVGRLVGCSVGGIVGTIVGDMSAHIS